MIPGDDLHPLARLVLSYFAVDEAREASDMEPAELLSNVSMLLARATPDKLHDALTDLLEVARLLLSRGDRAGSNEVAALVERCARQGAQRWGGVAAMTRPAEDAGRRFSAFASRHARLDPVIAEPVALAEPRPIERAWATMTDERRARLAEMARAFLSSASRTTSG
jgi:hypothetical protein